MMLTPGLASCIGGEEMPDASNFPKAAASKLSFYSRFRVDFLLTNPSLY